MLRYLANDHLGGTAIVLTEAGAVETHTRYTPFGQVWTQTGGTPATDKLFTGHERKGATSGLYYAGARFYSADLGRFLSEDPLVQPGANPYAYVLNNPLRYRDPTGMYPIADLDQQGPAPGTRLPDRSSLLLSYAVGNVGLEAPTLLNCGLDCMGDPDDWFWRTLRSAWTLQAMGIDINMLYWSWDQRELLANAELPVTGSWLDAPSEYEATQYFEEVVVGVAVGLTLDNAFQSGGTFKSWLRRAFPSNKPYSLQDSKRIWVELERRGYSLDFHSAHPNRPTWNVPHIHVKGRSVHIPVDKDSFPGW